jgi:hypothetical protein
MIHERYAEYSTSNTGVLNMCFLPGGAHWEATCEYSTHHRACEQIASGKGPRKTALERWSSSKHPTDSAPLPGFGAYENPVSTSQNSPYARKMKFHTRCRRKGRLALSNRKPPLLGGPHLSKHPLLVSYSTPWGQIAVKLFDAVWLVDSRQSDLEDNRSRASVERSLSR